MKIKYLYFKIRDHNYIFFYKKNKKTKIIFNLYFINSLENILLNYRFDPKYFKMLVPKFFRTVNSSIEDFIEPLEIFPERVVAADIN